MHQRKGSPSERTSPNIPRYICPYRIEPATVVTNQARNTLHLDLREPLREEAVTVYLNKNPFWVLVSHSDSEFLCHSLTQRRFTRTRRTIKQYQSVCSYQRVIHPFLRKPHHRKYVGENPLPSKILHPCPMLSSLCEDFACAEGELKQKSATNLIFYV